MPFKQSKYNFTNKQEMFCRNYIIDFNGSAAAIKAGYSEHTAARIASQLLIKLDIQQTE